MNGIQWEVKDIKVMRGIEHKNLTKKKKKWRTIFVKKKKKNQRFFHG